MDRLLLETVARLVNSHDDRIDQLEEKMAATDDLVTRLGTATDEIASDLADLRDQVANLDPAIAAKFEPLVARLEAMGQDPADPVPAPTP
jgi:uncharacterized coiled-coil protein SlyX